MKSYHYMELTPYQLNQVALEIERMHRESIQNTKMAVAALRSPRGEGEW